LRDKASRQARPI